MYTKGITSNYEQKYMNLQKIAKCLVVHMKSLLRERSSVYREINDKSNMCLVDFIHLVQKF